MKKTYSAPALNVFGAVETLTAFEGDITQTDVIINSAGVQIGNIQGLGSIDACTEIGGRCLGRVRR